MTISLKQVLLLQAHSLHTLVIIHSNKHKNQIQKLKTKSNFIFIFYILFCFHFFLFIFTQNILHSHLHTLPTIATQLKEEAF